MAKQKPVEKTEPAADESDVTPVFIPAEDSASDQPVEVETIANTPTDVSPVEEIVVAEPVAKPEVVNPTPTKPTLEFMVESGNTSVTGFFVDESAAIAYFTSVYGSVNPHPPTVTCFTDPRIPKIYSA